MTWTKSRQIHKFGLKIEGYEIVSGRSCLDNLVQNDKRCYVLDDEVNLMIVTNQGTLHVVTNPCFIFDGRSGPRIIDWYAPNLGTFEERLSWFVHDCNGYALDLSFEDTNILLFAMLRDLAHYRTAKANIIQLAVGISKSWYGEPKENDWCRCNVGKVRTCWLPKE